MVFEIILPGLISVFIGLACISVFLLIKFSLIDGFIDGFVAFFIFSIFYLLVFRTLFQRFLPSSYKKANIDEDQNAIGDEVKILKQGIIGEVLSIYYQGTYWDAISHDSNFNIDDKAYIVGRDNLTWIISNKKKED